MSARLQVLHFTSPLRRKGLAVLRGLTTLGARAPQQFAYAIELGRGDDGWEGVRHPHGVGPVLGVHAPGQDMGYSINTKKSGTHGGLGLTIDHEAQCGSNPRGWGL